GEQNIHTKGEQNIHTKSEQNIHTKGEQNIHTKSEQNIHTKSEQNIHTKSEHNIKDIETVKNLMERYKNLRSVDKKNLICNHLTSIKEKDINEIYEYVNKKKIEERKEVEEEYEKKRRLKLSKLRKPAYLQSKSVKKKITTDVTTEKEYDIKACINNEKELKCVEKYTLIEDMYKAYIYAKSFMLLNNEYITKQVITNDFFYIMINAIKKNLIEKIKPTLINEFAVYKNPYMLLKNALYNYILNQYVKNKYEESLIEEYINKNVLLRILKLNSAEVPVYVYEPLVSFHGDTSYNFDLQQKFKDVINTCLQVLNLLKIYSLKNGGEIKQEEENWSTNNEKVIYHDKKGDNNEKNSQGVKSYDRDKGGNNNNSDNIINEVLKILPENKKYHFENYPFENLKSFKTNIRKKYIGGIKNEKPLNIDEEELGYMRYPNLQCVAHSLPKDEKYRDNVIHTIKVLERSKYWDHSSKIKAINTLIDVWNEMNNSEFYEKMLDKALPTKYDRNMLRKTRTRKASYNMGLTYIQSLTTQKPVHMRTKKN
ncbi:conserved protein, unknown function, partial [Hepatocystis sp. ex Piliocolobus tephrosceles]